MNKDIAVGSILRYVSDRDIEYDGNKVLSKGDSICVLNITERDFTFTFNKYLGITFY